MHNVSTALVYPGQLTVVPPAGLRASRCPIPRPLELVPAVALMAVVSPGVATTVSGPRASAVPAAEERLFLPGGELRAGRGLPVVHAANAAKSQSFEFVDTTRGAGCVMFGA